MTSYAEILTKDDARIRKIFDVEAETIGSGSVVIEDPFPELNRLRDVAPVHRGSLGDLMGYPGRRFTHHLDGHPTYTAFTFSAVSRGLIENETFSSHAYYTLGTVAGFGETILNKVGNEHRRYRGPIQPLFSPEAAETWWSQKIIDETVETLISSIETKRESDLFLDLCARMPVHVVSGGFGLDPEDVIPFRMGLQGLNRHDAIPDERRNAALTVHNVLTRVIEARRKAPQDDIISKLVASEVAFDDGSSRPFTNDEIISHCILIVLAGGGTTWRQLGITLYALLNNPAQFEALKADRSLAPRVILESARWHPTDLIFPRLVQKDVVLEGVELPQGALLHLCLGSANRDPRRWVDPDRFDMMRGVQRSLAFGGGPHSCLGQHVSRQEMVTALNAVIDRLPNLRWDPSKPPARLVGGLFARGPSSLPVLFG
jgi:cytochrome P450